MLNGEGRIEMKYINALVLLLLLMHPPLVSFAQSEMNEHEGFFGNIVIGGGMAFGRPSQLDVTDDNSTLKGLDERADRYSEAVSVIMAEIAYAFKGTEISLGTQADFNSALSLAVNQSLGTLGSARAIIGYGLESAWQDPYLVGVVRQETDQTSISLEIDYENILGTGALLSVSGSRIDVADDLIAVREPGLKRGGATVSVGTGYVFTFGDNHALSPTLDLIVDDRDGASNSSVGYQLGVSHMLALGPVIFETSLAYAKTTFDRIHPIFGRIREEEQYGISEFITYAEPFGWQGISFNGMIAYNRADANIRFFDSDVVVVGLGIGYSF
jgi:hypothetical protein